MHGNAVYAVHIFNSQGVRSVHTSGRVYTFGP
jgi:hypothetical protein